MTKRLYENFYLDWKLERQKCTINHWIFFTRHFGFGGWRIWPGDWTEGKFDQLVNISVKVYSTPGKNLIVSILSSICRKDYWWRSCTQNIKGIAKLVKQFNEFNVTVTFWNSHKFIFCLINGLCSLSIPDKRASDLKFKKRQCGTIISRFH